MPLGVPANNNNTSLTCALNTYSLKQRNIALTLTHAQTILYKYRRSDPSRRQHRSQPRHTNFITLSSI